MVQQMKTANKTVGFFRRLKNYAILLWLPFFLLPYYRWEGQQAILFDLSQRQINLFSWRLLPQDWWLMGLIILFVIGLIVLLTRLAGRVICGFVCAQTVWSELFHWIEIKCEGRSQRKIVRRGRLLSLGSILRKGVKHSLWLALAFLTAMTVVAWFYDAMQLWPALLNGQLSTVLCFAVIIITMITYLAAGWLKEQVCLWFCPYGRLQSLLMTQYSPRPVYDQQRGQRKTEPGHCIDCQLCVAVCPTGIDIRHGWQQACISCGLCIDACDSVMEKQHQPKRLIAYRPNPQRDDTLQQDTMTKWLAGLLGLLLLWLGYQITFLSDYELKVTPQRHSQAVQLKTGEIQNRYRVVVENKTAYPQQFELILFAPKEIYMMQQAPISIPAYQTLPLHILLRAKQPFSGVVPLTFALQTLSGDSVMTTQSIFTGAL